MRALLTAACLLFTLAACAQPGSRAEPEAPSGRAEARAPATADRRMVVAAHPLAAEAGREILRAGGSAIDAAIATQLVLGLVEPQSSGIGGGAFLLRYDAARGAVTAFDGRETAPMAATEALFLQDDGTPIGFWDAVVGGRSVGVPGTLAMLQTAHARHGELAWARLFQPAIQLARQGFEVTPRLHTLIARDRFLDTYAPARAYFYTDAGEPLPVGHLLKNPAYARTLEIVARDGARAFYEGAIARDIVRTVRSVAGNPGKLSRRDMARYEAKVRPALCRPYRDHTVCGHPPPTSGGATLLQILGILEAFDLPAMRPMAVEPVHLLAEASRLAFADRNRFLADSDFVDVPLDRLLSDPYLRRRAGLIDPDASLGKAEPGFERDLAPKPDQAGGRSTSHYSIVDADGNAVSATASVEQAFGARLMVRGFMLNNQLTDFSFVPERDGKPVANRVQPGKRPRSSMAPTIVTDADGGFRLAVGSPGGSRIIGYTTLRVLAVLDWGLNVQTAVELPNVVNRNGPTALEAGTSAEALAGPLRDRGHEVEIETMTSGLHAIERRDGRLYGGADPRREGVALGD
ncbi:gamma-glutamyltransferase [Rhodovibrio sodomensis]|uniref:Glutathione hydrolase proenzyme n=1 Tax=Rhodovibrio sodomensis TaxID=1088 RepID=A0ABS1DD96_9PROT|nr:gamma-glutamyltransferase [Rhodovibrio sodomensis]MBK1667896.1 gamma-glutamyltransferase [Rhodovibrio sodomensis]